MDERLALFHRFPQLTVLLKEFLRHLAAVTMPIIQYHLRVRDSLLQTHSLRRGQFG